MSKERPTWLWAPRLYISFGLILFIILTAKHKFVVRTVIVRLMIVRLKNVVLKFYSLVTKAMISLINSSGIAGYLFRKPFRSALMPHSCECAKFQWCSWHCREQYQGPVERHHEHRQQYDHSKQTTHSASTMAILHAASVLSN